MDTDRKDKEMRTEQDGTTVWTNAIRDEATRALEEVAERNGATLAEVFDILSGNDR